jgi:hypothetical protein
VTNERSHDADIAPSSANGAGWPYHIAYRGRTGPHLHLCRHPFSLCALSVLWLPIATPLHGRYSRVLADLPWQRRPVFNIVGFLCECAREPELDADDMLFLNS